MKRCIGICQLLLFRSHDVDKNVSLPVVEILVSLRSLLHATSASHIASGTWRRRGHGIAEETLTIPKMSCGNSRTDSELKLPAVTLVEG